MPRPPEIVANYRLEQPGDEGDIARVIAAAFGRADEARLVERLRAEGHARAAWVAEVSGEVVGHVLYSELSIVSPAGSVPALALAPVAVAPHCQRQGIGSQLIRHSLAACRAAGQRAVFVLGDPSYYGRFGFSAERARAFESPYAGEHFMALELAEGAIAGSSGQVVYPPPFAAV